MALTVVRPCVVCNAPMQTQRASKQTCSHRCYMQHHRAQQRQATPTTTRGNSMSQLFQPDAAHLKRLQDFEVGQYNTRTQCNIQGREQLGIMEEFEVQGLQQALDKYVELVAQGFVPTGEIAHLPKLIAGPTVDWVILSLRKPELQIEKRSLKSSLKLSRIICNAWKLTKQRAWLRKLNRSWLARSAESNKPSWMPKQQKKPRNTPASKPKCWQHLEANND